MSAKVQNQPQHACVRSKGGQVLPAATSPCIAAPSAGRKSLPGWVRVLHKRFLSLELAAFYLLILLPGGIAQATPDSLPGKIQVEVTLPEMADRPRLTGRVFLFVASTNQTEPRFESKASLFGQDIRAVKAGEVVTLDSQMTGDPEEHLADLAPGNYFVQAVFNLYTEFHRADGHTIWAHMDQWEGQDFKTSPGNLFSQPQAFQIGADGAGKLKLKIDQVIPPISVPPDDEWVQRIKFESPLLTKFWGHPIYLGATILLPKDYAMHPEQRYPVIYIQGHFGLGAPFGFSAPSIPGGPQSGTRQPDKQVAQASPPPGSPPGTNGLRAPARKEKGQEFSADWTSDDFPRMIAVTFQHPTPYFDDSYGVNSPNCGPYGDAIMQELIPAIERRFRTIKQASARLLTGSSTGGWGSLALQLYHPEFFGGTWAFSPDPVDFRLYYGGVNLYEETNAYAEKPGEQFRGGGSSNRRGSHRAAVLGTQDGRWEWWKHTPCGPDGYPLPVWNLATGEINREVVRQMQAHNFDLRDYLARNWSRLGPNLIGKLHVCAADTDGFYSNLAVHLLDEFMQHSVNPHEAGSFQYGPVGSHHGWQPTSNSELIRTMAKYVADHSSGAK